MSMVTVSAPGKVILFGEHAVVYGRPSLVSAIDRRIYVSLETRDDNKIAISSNAEPRDLSFPVGELRTADGFPYIRKAVELAFERTGRESGLDIEISSEIPPASGLGSSASVSVATIMAVCGALGTEISKEELAKLGHRVEFEVQGAASPTDTAVTTFGGVLFVEPEKEEHQRIDVSLPLVVGYTGIERSTGALVENVRALKEKSPEIVDPIIENIGRITVEAKYRIENGEDIGELMNTNHGLLVELGVSSPELDSLVKAALDAGARGAKITGAGGGGCMIAYAPDSREAVANAIEKLGFRAFDSATTSEGVAVE